ncbi:sigma-54 interaction domain-containing protein [Anaerobacillus sp. MEB173]|uniref:sigma-54 interaction domain-containing protein n=1 Tax=Anaerobacillus sp. MEB173 TaxID=3383345 RepID=UPI003F936FA6
MFLDTKNAKGIEISAEVLLNILDHSSDEIYVMDKDTRIVYVNKVCERHYGLKPNEVIGNYNDDFVSKNYWTPSIIPFVFKEKKPVTIKQSTYINGELITTAIPILNNENEIELIVITAHEPNYKKLYIPTKLEEKERLEDRLFDKNLITKNEKMKHLFKFCEKIARVNTTILIQGESGTGKSVVANYIHNVSQRKNGPFLGINCAAIPEELLESELFGYADGSFTGANRGGKKGLLESVNNGTFFLDEIGEISPKMQAKLLQVIQDKKFLPVGGRVMKEVDIRFIAATNRNLFEMVEQKLFREDLYYRLNVIDLKIPSLRERTEDITPLTYSFLNKFNKKYETSITISQEALDVITSYSWPGNVRQLENVIERLVVTSESIIECSDLPENILQATQNIEKVTTLSVLDSLDSAIEEFERNLIINSYKKYQSTRKVASDLRISQTRASKLIRKYCY